jgi:hypothetical protein
MKKATATSHGRRRLAAFEGSATEGGETNAFIYDAQSAWSR